MERVIRPVAADNSVRVESIEGTTPTPMASYRGLRRRIATPFAPVCARHEHRCTWKSSPSATSWPSWTDSRRPRRRLTRVDRIYGRGSHGHGTAGARPYTSSSRKPSSRGTDAPWT
jgi:hypothetical protein